MIHVRNCWIHWEDVLFLEGLHAVASGAAWGHL
jgi:hypothetical protein